MGRLRQARKRRRLSFYLFLWSVAPDVALTLAVTIPSGVLEFAQLRSKLGSSLCGSPWFCDAMGGILNVVHNPFASTLPSPPGSFYCGFGDGRSQLPSLWCNPFGALNYSPEKTLDLFRDYACSRCDAVQWLAPLCGSTLMCDCSVQEFCHTSILDKLVNDLFVTPRSTNAPTSSQFANADCDSLAGDEDLGARYRG